MECVDALVLGAGPAGATVALNLAPFRRVLVIERAARVRPRIGESLPGAAHRLLRDMGLWDAFRSDGHLPCHARRSLWGGPAPVETDAVSDLDGPGWSLDRARFEARLRVAAAARGAHVLTPARARVIARRDGAWTVEVVHDGSVRPVRARLLIDARGRAARPLPGGVRRAGDRLVCGWLRLSACWPAGVVHVEAAPDGWWYGTGVPGDRSVVAFHTDADLPAAAEARDRHRLLAGAARLQGATIAPGEIATGGFCAAHGCRLDRAAGDGWLAVGDAALAFDPLSSQGLLNALYTGLCAAEAADRMLAGSDQAAGEYARTIDALWAAYERHLAAYYAQERRWPASPFWARRARPQVVSLR